MARLFDNFTRTENPIASGWSATSIWNGDSPMQANGSAAQGTGVSLNNSSWWTQPYGPNQEFFGDADSNNADQHIYLRVNNPNNVSTMSGFQIQFFTQLNQMNIWGNYAGNQQDFLVSNAAPLNGVTLSAATKFWAFVIGTTQPEIVARALVSGVWIDVAWAKYGSPANIILQGGGFVGMQLFDADPTRFWDNVGGGDIEDTIWIPSRGRRPVPMIKGPDNDRSRSVGRRL